MLTPTEILRALENCIFDDLTEYNFYENVIKLMDQSVICGNAYDTGATKLVLIPPLESFVIKIPFCGMGNECYDEYDEESDEPLMYPFECAAEPDHWDYCEAEVLKWEKAAEAGLGHLLAKIELIGHVHGHPIYIQDKMEIFGESRTLSHYSPEIRQKTIDKCNELDVACFNSSWLSDFLDYFSEQTLKKLYSWLSDNCIFDLHSGNIGYVPATGQPIIVDYGDFYD